MDSFRFSRRRGRGFSLVEALVALLLLAGGVALLASMFSAANLALVKARNSQIAADAAAGLIEQMRRVGAGSLNYSNFPQNFNVYAPDDPTKIIGDGQLTITPVYYGGNPQPIYYEVTVRTTVIGTRGTRGTAQVVTYIAPR